MMSRLFNEIGRKCPILLRTHLRAMTRKISKSALPTQTPQTPPTFDNVPCPSTIYCSPPLPSNTSQQNPNATEPCPQICDKLQTPYCCPPRKIFFTNSLVLPLLATVSPMVRVWTSVRGLGVSYVF